MENKNKKSIGGIGPLMLATFLAIASVVYIIYRGVSDRIYAEKWKEYDECGLM